MSVSFVLLRSNEYGQPTEFQLNGIWYEVVSRQLPQLVALADTTEGQWLFTNRGEFIRVPWHTESGIIDDGGILRLAVVSEVFHFDKRIVQQFVCNNVMYDVTQNAVFDIDYITVHLVYTDTGTPYTLIRIPQKSCTLWYCQPGWTMLPRY